MKKPGHKIIFEGAELAGKSFLMSQIYDFLEPKYSSGGRILDGCHWFNCDVGLYGTKFGRLALLKYLELMEALEGANVMLEKFHISEAVYQKLYNNFDFDFSPIEKRLKALGGSIILVVFDEDEDLLKKRIEDRLNLYPHYKKIAQKPKDYIKQQGLYLDLIKSSQLPHQIINASVLPDDALVKQALKFLGEK